MPSILSNALYQRYLQREVLAAVMLVLLAFLALFSFFDFVDELRRVGSGTYDIWRAALVVALSLPGLVYELVPIACLIGALYALSTMARHSEITVLRASGMSTAGLLGTLCRAALLLAVLTFLIGEVLVPFTEKLAHEIKANALNRVVAQQGFSSGVWVKDGRSFVNIRRVTTQTFLEGIRIYRFDDRNALVSVTDAASASFDKTVGWRIQEVVRTALAGDRASVERLPEDVWASSVTPNLLAVLMVPPERMSLMNIFSYTRHLAENRQNTDRYVIAMWKKFLYPLSALVMVALALPFGYAHDRVGGVSLKIFTGVMLGIAFYALNGLFSNLGVINAWPPFASAAAPSALFLLAAGAMIWWVERR
ncbi:LPS export ABC transporter permease LptG [Azonexus sp. R2A61]|uniref:LPS export ABC transporter permease LptG n=1 Tax=Azonexus sp. R2A61 TaxID=2744443 RepID=UPI001F255B89|nr:LPS export ABC transporter permease LptG [Azonexus sp. R2A61]